METAFERKPNESAKAFEAFQLYADKGPDRSLAAVGQALGKSGSLIERWSRLYHWVERAWAYDVHMARAKHEAEEAALREESAEWKRREKEHKENLWRVSKACLHAGEEALKRFYENARKGATLGDVSHIFDVGAKLGGLATGTATERTEVTGLNGGPIQVDLLPALRKVFGQIVDARDGLGTRPPGDDRQILLIPRGDGLESSPPALPEPTINPTNPTTP